MIISAIHIGYIRMKMEICTGTRFTREEGKEAATASAAPKPNLNRQSLCNYRHLGWATHGNPDWPSFWKVPQDINWFISTALHAAIFFGGLHDDDAAAVKSEEGTRNGRRKSKTFPSCRSSSAAQLWTVDGCYILICNAIALHIDRVKNRHYHVVWSSSSAFAAHHWTGFEIRGQKWIWLENEISSSLPSSSPTVFDRLHLDHEAV